MYCEKCGATIPDKSKFCPECGEKLILEENIVKESPKEELKEEVIDAEVVETKAAEATEPKAAEAAEPKANNATETKADKATEATEPKADKTAEGKNSQEEEPSVSKRFAESEAVQNAKKEVNDIFEEAKTASDIQNGSTPKEGAAMPRQEVSFMVKWFYWTGRRDRFDYLLVAITTSIASLALGANPLISFVLCYISAVNLVKRLHDTDHSGWFALFLMVVEYIILNLTWLFGLLGLGIMAAGSFVGLLVFLIPLLIVWGIKLWIFFMPGTNGTNSYGPVPK